MGTRLCTDLTTNISNSRFLSTEVPSESEEYNIDKEPSIVDKRLPYDFTGKSGLTPNPSKPKDNFSGMPLDSTTDQDMLKTRGSFRADQTVDSPDDSKSKSKLPKLQASVADSLSGLDKLSKRKGIENPSSLASTKGQFLETKSEDGRDSVTNLKSYSSRDSVGCVGFLSASHFNNIKFTDPERSSSHGAVSQLVLGKPLPGTQSVAAKVRELGALPEMEQVEPMLNDGDAVPIGDTKDIASDSPRKMDNLSNITPNNDASSQDGSEMEISNPELSQRKSVNFLEDSNNSEMEKPNPGPIRKKSVNLFDDSTEEEPLQPSKDELSEDKLFAVETADSKEQVEDKPRVISIALCPKSEDENKWHSPRTSQEDETLLQLNDQEIKEDWLEDCDTSARYNKRSQNFSGSSAVSASFSSERRDRAYTIPTSIIDSNLITVRKRAKFEDLDSHVIPGNLETIKSVLLNEQQLSYIFESDPSSANVTVAKWEKREGGYITTVKFTKDINKKVFKIKVNNVAVSKVFRITWDDYKVRVWDTTSQSGVRYSEILQSHNVWTFRSKQESEPPECTMDIEFGLEFLKKPNIPGLKKTMKKEARKQSRKWNERMSAEIVKSCQVHSQPNLFD